MLGRLDPYFIWRLLLQPELWRAVVDGQWRGQSEGLHTILVHKRASRFGLVNPDLLLPGDELCGLNEQFLPAHTHAAWGSGFRPCYQPGLITTQGLKLLFHLACERHTELCNNVERWEYCQPGGPLEFRAQVTGTGAQEFLRAPEHRQVTFQQLNKAFSLLAQKGPEPEPSRPGAGPTPTEPTAQHEPRVCVIDDGCNFASPTVTGSLQQLLVQAVDRQALQDLDAAGQFLPALEVVKAGSSLLVNGSLLGRRMRFDSPATRGAAPLPGASDAEPHRYGRSRYLHPVPHKRHGAAVLDLVVNPCLRIGDKPAQRARPKEVHFVQLPTPTVLDTSGGSLAAHVLAAMHDALNVTKPWQDLLVNLSFGTHGGSHDGTSMLESAYLELLNAFDRSHATQGKRLLLSVPAGNSHLMRCHSHGWAQEERASSFDWKVLPDDDSHNFVELWLPKGRTGVVTVQHPDGRRKTELKWSPDLALCSSIQSLDEGNGARERSQGYVIYAENPSQSKTCALVLIGVLADSRLKTEPEKWNNFFAWRSCPKDGVFSRSEDEHESAHDGRPSGQAPQGPSAHGIWRISVRPTDNKPLPWDAYVQRGDHAPMRRRAARGSAGRQSYILDNSESRATPMSTLNGIATARHPRLFVVGSLERADGRLSPYSSAGANTAMSALPAAEAPDVGERTEGPDWVVAGDESRRRPGLLVQGVLSGSRVRVSGTSMSTAAFTRHLWEHLAANKPLESLVGLPSQDEPAPTKVPESAADHAPDFTRGYFRRITPVRPDGSLN